MFCLSVINGAAIHRSLTVSDLDLALSHSTTRLEYIASSDLCFGGFIEFAQYAKMMATSSLPKVPSEDENLPESSALRGGGGLD